MLPSRREIRRPRPSFKAEGKSSTKSQEGWVGPDSGDGRKELIRAILQPGEEDLTGLDDSLTYESKWRRVQVGPKGGVRLDFKGQAGWSF